MRPHLVGIYDNPPGIPRGFKHKQLTLVRTGVAVVFGATLGTPGWEITGTGTRQLSPAVAASDVSSQVHRTRHTHDPA